jgi:hypothetical protein
MATSAQVRTDAQEKHGVYLPNCWIAHVKELNGLTPMPAPNRRSFDARVKPCRAEVRPIIEASMRRGDII